MIEKVKEQVASILNEDKSGHGMDHIERVYNLAIKFAKEEKADKEIVSLASLLHDIDDYKIIGKENAGKLNNATKIMNRVNISKEKQERVIEIIKNMGYSKSLKGIRPKTIEGMCVSDADLCDAIGAIGIIRSIVYAVSDKGTGVIFDKNIFPLIDVDSEIYNQNGTNYGKHDNAINHCFDKILKLKDLMMTNTGKKEAQKRHEFIISFLKEFFYEEDIPEWLKFFEEYLKNLNK